MTVEELGEILELVKSGAGDAESKYQFVDVREEEELGKAKLDGKREASQAYRSPCTRACCTCMFFVRIQVINPTVTADVYSAVSCQQCDTHLWDGETPLCSIITIPIQFASSSHPSTIMRRRLRRTVQGDVGSRYSSSTHNTPSIFTLFLRRVYLFAPFLRTPALVFHYSVSFLA